MEKVPYLFFGSPPIGPIALKALELADYKPAAVITDTKLSLDEQLDLVEQYKATFILVVGYGAILKQPLLDSVAGQVLNIHPSLLPAYRGPAPVVQALLDGVTETGVTLIQIDREVDHGPMLAQTTYPLTGKETPHELYTILIQRGVELFMDSIEGYLDETLELTEQNHSEATFTHFIKKEDGLLDLSEPADVLERKVRAFQDWPTTWVLHRSKRLIIHSAHIEGDSLRFDQVQPENGKRMTLEAYCAGLRIKPAELYKELSS